jgi:hypothetical protein
MTPDLALENLTLIITRNSYGWAWALRDTRDHILHQQRASSALELFKTIPPPLCHTAALLIERVQPGTFINARKI